jgi:hypothetical protein
VTGSGQQANRGLTQRTCPWKQVRRAYVVKRRHHQHSGSQTLHERGHQTHVAEQVVRAGLKLNVNDALAWRRSRKPQQ